MGASDEHAGNGQTVLGLLVMGRYGHAKSVVLGPVTVVRDVLALPMHTMWKRLDEHLHTLDDLGHGRTPEEERWSRFFEEYPQKDLTTRGGVDLKKPTPARAEVPDLDYPLYLTILQDIKKQLDRTEAGASVAGRRLSKKAARHKTQVEEALSFLEDDQGIEPFPYPDLKRSAEQEPSMSTAPVVFVSYSWDSEEHKAWVRELAARLRKDGVDAKLDKWETAPGDQLPEFMERSIRESKYVLIICTPHYKEKSDERKGGVGYEGDIMTAEVLTGRDRRKFIPVLRAGTWKTSLPSWLKGCSSIDLRGSPSSEEQYTELLDTVHDRREKAPPVGTVPKKRPSATTTKGKPKAKSKPKPAKAEFGVEEPIRIVEVIADEVTEPANDGTRGSALYTIPLRLSREAPPLWGTVFEEIWDNPPEWTTMHRSGIVRIVGDRLYLNGTTIEEVKQVHLKTLKLVAEATNKKAREIAEAKLKRWEARQARERDHKKNVRDVADGIDFD